MNQISKSRAVLPFTYNLLYKDHGEVKYKEVNVIDFASVELPVIEVDNDDFLVKATFYDDKGKPFTIDYVNHNGLSCAAFNLDLMISQLGINHGHPLTVLPGANRTENFDVNDPRYSYPYTAHKIGRYTTLETINIDMRNLFDPNNHTRYLILRDYVFREELDAGVDSKGNPRIKQDNRDIALDIFHSAVTNSCFIDQNGIFYMPMSLPKWKKKRLKVPLKDLLSAIQENDFSNLRAIDQGQEMGRHDTSKVDMHYLELDLPLVPYLYPAMPFSGAWEKSEKVAGYMGTDFEANCYLNPNPSLSDLKWGTSGAQEYDLRQAVRTQEWMNSKDCPVHFAVNNVKDSVFEASKTFEEFYNAYSNLRFGLDADVIPKNDKTLCLGSGNLTIISPEFTPTNLLKAISRFSSEYAVTHEDLAKEAEDYFLRLIDDIDMKAYLQIRKDFSRLENGFLDAAMHGHEIYRGFGHWSKVKQGPAFSAMARLFGATKTMTPEDPDFIRLLKSASIFYYNESLELKASTIQGIAARSFKKNTARLAAEVLDTENTGFKR